MKPEERSYIDALARDKNRANGVGCALSGLFLMLAPWVILALLFALFFGVL